MKKAKNIEDIMKDGFFSSILKRRSQYKYYIQNNLKSMRKQEYLEEYVEKCFFIVIKGKNKQ